MSDSQMTDPALPCRPCSVRIAVRLTMIDVIWGKGDERRQAVAFRRRVNAVCRAMERFRETPDGEVVPVADDVGIALARLVSMLDEMTADCDPPCSCRRPVEAAAG
jgi:hypothetical protein